MLPGHLSLKDCAESRKWLSASFPGHYLSSEWRRGTAQWRIINIVSEMILLSRNGERRLLSEPLYYIDFGWQIRY
jgi:hypothetical protein